MMVILALVALLGGVAYGLGGLNWPVVEWLAQNTDYILYALMLLVGISVGMHEGIVDNMRQYHIKILLIPCGIIAGSLAGGVLCSLLLRTPMGESTAIASGLGWYSLTGVAIGNLSGAQYGSIAFLSNLMREIFSFFSIPFLARHLNVYSCIAAAGATSEDTTLPMMIRYIDGDTVVLSVLNGVICSACVPVLLSICYHLFS